MAKNRGIHSMQTKVSFAKYTAGVVGAFTEIENIYSIPSLGGDVNQIDITNLMCTQKLYINGLKDLGSSGLEFKAFYDAEETDSNYRVINALGKEVVRLRIELGDKPIGGTHGSYFEFDAQLTPSLDEVTVDDAIKFTIKAALQSDVEFTAPNA